MQEKCANNSRELGFIDKTRLRQVSHMFELWRTFRTLVVHFSYTSRHFAWLRALCAHFPRTFRALSAHFTLDTCRTLFGHSNRGLDSRSNRIGDWIRDPIESGIGFESQPIELGIDWVGIGFESESIWGLYSRVNRIGFENKSNWGLASRANQSNGDWILEIQSNRGLDSRANRESGIGFKIQSNRGLDSRANRGSRSNRIGDWIQEQSVHFVSLQTSDHTKCTLCVTSDFRSYKVYTLCHFKIGVR